MREREGRKAKKKGKKKKSGRKPLDENCTLYLKWRFYQKVLGNSAGEKPTAETALCYHI